MTLVDFKRVSIAGPLVQASLLLNHFWLYLVDCDWLELTLQAPSL